MEERFKNDEVWTGEMQLLALLIEVLSIQVSGKQIKKPIDIPRPGKKGKGNPRERAQEQQQQQQQGAPQMGPAADRDAAFKKGISVLQKTTKSRG